MTDVSPAADAALDQARALVRSGQIEQAEQRFVDILATRPDEIEALNFVAMCALRRGQSPRAIALLEHAQDVRPDAETSKSLGLAYRAIGKLDAARAALEASVALDPVYFVARLHLGHVLDQLGDRARAATTFVRAISAAQLRGQWLDEASTPPPLLNLVRHAMRASYDARRQAFERALAPARASFGSAALRRVDLALLGVLGDVPIRYPDARQKPIFSTFPTFRRSRISTARNSRGWPVWKAKRTRFAASSSACSPKTRISSRS